MGQETSKLHGDRVWTAEYHEQLKKDYEIFLSIETYRAVLRRLEQNENLYYELPDVTTALTSVFTQLSLNDIFIKAKILFPDFEELCGVEIMKLMLELWK